MDEIIEIYTYKELDEMRTFYHSTDEMTFEDYLLINIKPYDVIEINYSTYEFKIIHTGESLFNKMKQILGL